MMKFGKKLPWYLKQGIDVTNQGLEQNGEYFGKVLRFVDDNFLISTAPSIRCYGSPGVAIHKSAWNQFRVVEPV